MSNKATMSSLTTAIEVLASTIKQEKEKKEIKLYLFIVDMIVCIENPKESTDK